MQLHREWMMLDLKKLQNDRKAMKNLQEELTSLESEFNTLKATDYDKVPGNSGGNSQLEKMELNLAKREELIVCLKATKEHVEHMEQFHASVHRVQGE